jgi:nucleotide-binding universal stress UspA family protein
MPAAALLVADPDAALRPLLAHAQSHQIPVEPISFVTRDAAADIARLARARDARLVIMGFHKPVFGRTILGGTVHRVMTAAETDVAVFVDRGFVGARRILVPYLGGRHDRLALQLSSRLARHAKAAVTVLHVVAPGRTGGNGTGEAVRRAFDDASQALPVEVRLVDDASPVDAVLRAAHEFDLVVIGVSEEWGLESHLFGLRPERIAEASATSLLIVRAHEEAAVPGGRQPASAQPVGVEAAQHS